MQVDRGEQEVKIGVVLVKAGGRSGSMQRQLILGGFVTFL